MSKRPPEIGGMHHVALRVNDIDACVQFYTRLLGMVVEWQPDDDNYYLTSGTDNLALHRIDEKTGDGIQKLDHIGFILDEPAHVNQWFSFLKDAGVKIVAKVKDHRDGARSFYCNDPEGTVVQFIYHPPLSGKAI